MKIDGKLLAADIIKQLEPQIQELKSQNITPKIAIVTLGPETSWQSYVNQKIKLADKLGIETDLINLSDPTEATLLETIGQLNADNSVHGIIIQRPFPGNIHSDVVINSVNLEKDIDGFRNDSPYQVPAWLAVWHILEFTYLQCHPEFISGSQEYPTGMLKQVQHDTGFISWLQSKQIAVIGKGPTAGKPTTDGLKKYGLNPIVITRETPDASPILKSADFIISAVGKRVVKPEDLKSGVILIGIGLHRGEDGKLHGDYEETEIEQIASFYTPSPGGVGPINLAYLFQNLIKAAHTISL